MVQNWVREKECIYRLPKTSVGLQTQLISPMCYHLVFAAADRQTAVYTGQPLVLQAVTQ